MKKKYLQSLQMNIANSYYKKKASITCIFNQYNLYFYIRMFMKDRHSNVSTNFYFLIFLVKN